MSAETGRESCETLYALTYADTLRELSARYQIRPEKVSEALGLILADLNEDECIAFENATFGLKMSTDGDQQRVAVVLYGKTYMFDVVPYLGRAKIGDGAMASFNTLRPTAQMEPTAMPYECDRPCDLSGESFWEAPEGEFVPGVVSTSEPELLADGGSPSSQRLRLGIETGPKSFRDQVFGTIEE